ncbi:MAG: SapC family protein [Verrucomicrobiae bacterium]|nr:SapC family protein [Verrucomicrobiae bacterium]
MYQKPIALSSEEHRGVKLAPITSYDFASRMNSALLTGREILEAGKDYPVVFARNDAGEITALALLGLRNESNLFIDENGQWEEDFYIPALFRRYPFILAETPGAEASKLTVCVDSGYDGYNASEGMELFDAEGKQTEGLERALTFLTEFQQQHQRTRALITLLDGYGLFKDVSANITLPDGEKLGFGNLLMVDEEAMMKLEDEKILQLVRTGGLAWIYAHLVSISNFRDLMKREAQRLEAAGKSDEAKELKSLGKKKSK